MSQRQMAKMGGRAKAARMSPDARSAEMRRVVTIRWTRYKAAKAAAKEGDKT